MPTDRYEEDTGGADAPSVAEVVAEDEAFAEWPGPVETDASAKTEAADDAGALEEAREVAAADPAPPPDVAEPLGGDAAPEEAGVDEAPALAEEPGVVAPDEPATTEEAVSADTAGDTPSDADSAPATDEDRPTP